MKTFPLWPDSTSETPAPTLDYYEAFGIHFPGVAALILPGGGYGHLSAQEGEGYAGMFRLWGIQSFVCNYRLGSQGHRHPAMLQDAARALRTIRTRATEFNIHPDKIIVVGSSAGGHLAATLMTQWDTGNPAHEDPIERVSSRPDLGVLCYPVITMNKFTHAGSRDHLLGADASGETRDALSAELNVTTETPPAFLWHTVEDPAVPVENAMFFATALRKNGVPFEMHLYQDGGHGLGMKDGIQWTDDCYRWLRKRLA